MEVLLANPRGFCAGVDRAIEIVERALQLHGAPIYVRHEVVHNKFVVADLRSKGAIFVEDLAEVPEGATVIFSAHGVSQAVRREAEGRGLKVFDATCPLVTKVHVEVAKMREQGRDDALEPVGQRRGVADHAGQAAHAIHDRRVDGVAEAVGVLEPVRPRAQLREHRVEGVGQVADLVLASLDRAGFVVVAAQDAPGDGTDFHDRLGDAGQGRRRVAGA